jgi:hypothetical protein
MNQRFKSCKRGGQATAHHPTRKLDFQASADKETEIYVKAVSNEVHFLMSDECHVREVSGFLFHTECFCISAMQACVDILEM